MEGFWPKLARQASNVVRSITYKHQKRAPLVAEFIFFVVGLGPGLLFARGRQAVSAE